ncbi:hypothetical protein A3C23_04795 [Candidatus Roizmanbacteria bacterium RIFCSPHIGHO2_02_FULL_37_13b]|uniref:Peptidase S8/S53 domain-containing protein n=1 Tax=Candidatus Roizmanbacteria bacterium RIFCSPLOWO2_02_FULL_36_11 TaxID=1802071 RepID=A0A1F7JID3_9BACT|nr:MAG: hypothetical protein A3C23_04795 [Candidatus Roizmanbacteria bacterium RIFCSPHIGHO2_02_FULL_37_13b]OGK55374.1 MAG: hypothetical protein A3H78_03670 [Candidatus Roizmanbacteria bacterium RIFCSPLOWO2_02_FULL_36_11]
MRKNVIVVFFLLLYFVLFTQVQAVFDNNLKENLNSTDRIIIRTRQVESISKVQEMTKRLNLRFIRQLKIPKTYSVGLPTNKISQYVSLLKSDPMIEFIEPDYKVQALELTDDPGIINNAQWGMFKIIAAGNDTSAWTSTKGSPSTRIAIVDSGIDQNHSDLSQKIVVQRNCTDEISIDDIYGHGTHVAGIAAAETNNNLGVAGVGYNSSLINAKALDNHGSGYHSWIAECIRFAVDNNASVVNLSLGGSVGTQTLKDAIDYAWTKGAVVTCAAGNTGKSKAQYPALYDNCIAVAAIDKNDVKASFSTYGASWVDVAAPGTNIYSTMPNHTNNIGPINYGNLSGTSMSTPHVSGLAGLLRSMDNNFSNVQIRSLIEINADNISGTGNYWRYGRINAFRSVNDAIEITPTPSIPEVSPTIVLISPTVELTPVPTIIPPTIILSPTPSPTPLTTITPTPTPSNKPWWCVYVPQYSLCR